MLLKSTLLLVHRLAEAILPLRPLRMLNVRCRSGDDLRPSIKANYGTHTSRKCGHIEVGKTLVSIIQLKDNVLHFDQLPNIQNKTIWRLVNAPRAIW
jgi:hypothetical protein